MSYFPTGALEPPTDYADIDWKLCRPKNFRVLAIFKNFQRQLNRVLYTKKQALISEDGDIGPSTTAAVARAGFGTYDGCGQLASKSEAFAITWQNIADVLGAPADPLRASKNTPAPVAKPSATTPPFPGAPPPTGPPSDMMAALTGPLGLGAMAVGGFLLVRDDKRRQRARVGKAKSKRRRAGRRR